MKHKKQHGKDHDLDRYGVAHVDACGFGPKEILTLELLRYFCLSYAEPLTQGWLSAFKLSETALGQINGPLLAFNVSELLSAVRRERTNQFNFVDPRCLACSVRIFPTELAVMKLVRCAHLDNTKNTLEAARQIVEGGQTTDTIEAGHALASCLECIKMTKQFSATHPVASSRHIH